MKKSNNHTQSKIWVSNKDPIPTPISCHVNIGTLGEIEGLGYHRWVLVLGVIFILARGKLEMFLWSLHVVMQDKRPYINVESYNYMGLGHWVIGYILRHCRSLARCLTCCNDACDMKSSKLSINTNLLWKV